MRKVDSGVQMSKVSVLLSDEESERFDQYCRTHGYKKSTLLSKLIQELLDREGFPAQPSLFNTLQR